MERSRDDSTSAMTATRLSQHRPATRGRQVALVSRACIVCRDTCFPVYTCGNCRDFRRPPDLICGRCKLNGRRPCRRCGCCESSRRWWAKLLQNPFHSHWLKLVCRNQHYAVEDELSSAKANAGHRCSLCREVHGHEGECPLDVLTCEVCKAKVMRCDLRFHESVDCAETALGKMVPMCDLVKPLFSMEDEEDSQDLSWTCPICLLSVTPVRDLCSNGHHVCSHCWMELYANDANMQERGRLLCPVCRERLPVKPAPQLYHWEKTSDLYTAGCWCLLCGTRHGPDACPSLLTCCKTCFVLHPASFTGRHLVKECQRKPSQRYHKQLVTMWSANGEMPSDLLSLTLLLSNPRERDTNLYVPAPPTPDAAPSEQLAA